MATTPGAQPVILIPAHRQRLWGWPAVLNFCTGGLGAGFYGVAVVAADFLPSPTLTLASWLGPTLVLAGFAAVAMEAGRPWRGPRVLARVGTSWMSRETSIGGLFTALALAEVVAGSSGQRLLAALAAAGLVLAQGFVVRRARGVTAWDAPVIPLVFLVSAVVSGLGLYTLVELARGQSPGPALLTALLTVLVPGTMLWLTYLGWSDDAPFVDATRPLRARAMVVTLIGGGYVVPFGLATVAATLPVTAPAATALAAGLMVIGQIQSKAALILGAGQLRPITLALRPLSGRSS